MYPIFLHIDSATDVSDDSGLIIKQRTLPVCHPGPYTEECLPHDKRTLASLDFVAPLEYYCVKSLVMSVAELDLGRAPPVLYGGSHAQLRLMKTLIPFFDQNMPSSRMKYVDPQLWATLIQLFSHLPPAFRTYSLPLSDPYLPLLQAVNSSVDFTLITVLDLSSRRELTDDTIGALKPLTNLCVLDLSGTRVSTWGLKQLSLCLTHDEASGTIFGPWKLRILSMRDCKKVQSDVTPILQKFPLLAVIDLRGTLATELSHSGFESRPSSHLHPCYYPYSTVSWIDCLWTSFPKQLFSCWTEKPYILHVNSLNYPPPHLAQTSHHSTIRRHTNNAQGEDNILVLLPDDKATPKNTNELSTRKSITSRLNPYRIRGSEDGLYENQMKGVEKAVRFDHEDSNSDDLYYDEDGISCCDEDSLLYYEDPDEDDPFEWEKVWEGIAEVTAEHTEVKDFYSSLGSSAKRMGNQSNIVDEDDESDKAVFQSYPPITNEKQLKLMLFRLPPSFGDVHTHPTTGTTHLQPIKKRRMGEEIMKKRSNGTALAKTFLNMAGKTFKEPGKARDSQSTRKELSVSTNPFRIKKSDKCQPEEMSFTDSHSSKGSMVADNHVLPLFSSQKSSLSKRHSSQGNRAETSVARGFDLKAWATKGKK